MSIVFPKHEGSLHLTHNEHKNYYETIEQAECGITYGRGDWVSGDQRDKAIATDNVWALQWYPVTPIGFVLLQACDLDVLLAAALANEGNEDGL